MIKYLLIALLTLSTYCMGGVSVLGTRFVINNETKRLNIKVFNDHESDYLIKTNISNNSDEFILSPPLFILLKDTTNIVTIIPNKVKENKSDKLYTITIAAIPKSQLNNTSHAVSLAIRSHFHLIYRHAALKKADFNQLKLIKNEAQQFYLKNSSNFVFTLLISESKDEANGIRKTLSPNQAIPVGDYCKKSRCNLWISFVDDDESILKKLNLSSH